MSRSIRALLIVAALAVVVLLLFTTVFPWVSHRFIDDPTLDDPAAAILAGG